MIGNVFEAGTSKGIPLDAWDHCEQYQKSGR